MITLLATTSPIVTMRVVMAQSAPIQVRRGPRRRVLQRAPDSIARRYNRDGCRRASGVIPSAKCVDRDVTALRLVSCQTTYEQALLLWTQV
jgi:hypothetical protein